MQGLQEEKFKYNEKKNKSILLFAINNKDLSKAFYVFEIIGTRFKDKDVGNVSIVKECIYIIFIEKTIDSSSLRKQNNQAIRAHKVFWRALSCLMLKIFQSESAKFVFFVLKCFD